MNPMNAQMQENRSINQPEVKRRSSADEICDFSNQLSLMACEISDKTHSKLIPVMRSEPMCQNDSEKGKDYPPLFDNLWYSMNSIKSHLENINQMIELTDI
jgi:hypothetical protein